MQQPQILLVRGARQVVTLHGPEGIRRGAALQQLSVIEGGSVLIKDGRIECVGTTRRLENLKVARGASEISVDDAVILPGLIDPGLRVEPQRAKQKRLTDFGDQCLGLMRSCLQHGTLQVQVSASAGHNDARSDMAVLRQLARIGDHPIRMQRSWHASAQAGFEADSDRQTCELLAYLLKQKLAQAIDITTGDTGRAPPHSLLAATEHTEMPVNLTWTTGEPHVFLDLLTRLRVRSIACPFEIDNAKRELLEESTIPVILSPGALTLERPTGEIAQRLARSAPIALSSGYHSIDAPTFNMQMTIALTVLRLGLTPEQAISAATINAAHALGVGDQFGSIEVGKRADMIVLNLSDYRELPRRWGTNHVGMAIRDGKILFNRTGWKVSAA